MRIGATAKIRIRVKVKKIETEKTICHFSRFIFSKLNAFFLLRSTVSIDTKTIVPNRMKKTSNDPNMPITKEAKLALIEIKTSGTTTQVQLRRPDPLPNAPYLLYDPLNKNL